MRDAKPVTQRVQIDSSQSANVPLPVQANLMGVTAQGGAMFALGEALNNMSARVSRQGIMDAHDREVANTKASKEAGAAKAAENDVTGDAPDDWLKNANDIEKESYQETDGINAVGRFERSIQPELAKLGPDDDIDAFLQQHAEKFLDANALPGKSRQTFMVGWARSQDRIKDAYLRQSLAESLKRNEKSTSALLVSGIQDGTFLSPVGYARWRQHAADKGMHDDEIDGLAVDAIKASLQSGDVDIEKARALLQVPSAEGRPILADVPQYKQEIQLAAAAGERIQKQRRIDAQKAEFTDVAMQLNDSADRGVLSDHRIEAMREKFDQSPEWAVGLHNRNREAIQRAEVATTKAEEDSKALAEWHSYDSAHAFQAGYSDTKMGEAGDRALRSAMDSGDQSKVFAVIDHAMRTGAPIKSLGTILTRGIDPSNPQQATRYAQVYERARNISPTRAAGLIDDATRVKLTQWENAKMLGSTDMEAWGKVSQGANVDQAVAGKITTEAMKLVAKKLPTDFNDGGWFGHDTEIANGAELQSRARRKVIDMVQAGADAQTAADAAVQWVGDNFIKSGNRMVQAYGTGDGMNAVTSEAVTEVGKLWKEKLVAENAADPDAEVWFAPVQGAPNRWRLMEQTPYGYNAPVVHNTTTTDPDGTRHTEPQFVDIIPSAARLNYTAWKKQEEDKKIVNASTARHFDLPDDALTLDTVQSIHSILDSRESQLARNATFPEMVAGQDPEQYAKARRDFTARTDEQRRALENARSFYGDSSNRVQSFAEFLASQH